MAIENITRRLQNTTLAKTTGGSKQDEQEASAAGVQRGDDSVRLTDTVKDLKKVLANLDSIPVINSERVAAVKAELENGNYRIDAEQIAEKMISFEKQLPDG